MRVNGGGPAAEVDAERALLGAILLGAPLAEIRSFLRPDDFWDEARGRVYAEALRLDATGTPIDNMTLGAALKKLPAAPVGEGTMLDRIGGSAELLVFVKECPTHRNASHYAELI